MNIRLLEKIKEQILGEPTSVDMDDWDQPDPSTPCGTVACISGWAAHLSGHPNESASGEIFLELSEEQGEGLFYISDWPGDLIFEIRGLNPRTPEYAAVVAKRIDRFIETEGKE